MMKEADTIRIKASKNMEVPSIREKGDNAFCHVYKVYVTYKINKSLAFFTAE